MLITAPLGAAVLLGATVVSGTIVNALPAEKAKVSKSVTTLASHAKSTSDGTLTADASSGSKPKWDDKDKIVVSIDIPDADNFPMAAYPLLSNPTKNVAIVLSGRHIDLGWHHWSEVPGDAKSKTSFLMVMAALNELKKTVTELAGPAIRYMVAVPTSKDIGGWAKKLENGAHAWYAEEDKNVKEHSDIYMEVSKIRLVNFLTKLKSIRKDTRSSSRTSQLMGSFRGLSIPSMCTIGRGISIPQLMRRSRSVRTLATRT